DESGRRVRLARLAGHRETGRLTSTRLRAMSLEGSLAAQVGQARGPSVLLVRGRSGRQRVNVALTTLTVLVPGRALSSRTPTNRCRAESAGHRGRARESPPEAGRAATDTRVSLRFRALLPERQRGRPCSHRG